MCTPATCNAKGPLGMASLATTVQPVYLCITLVLKECVDLFLGCSPALHRGRLVSVESTQQEQLSLQRDMADDLEALLESFNGIQDRLDILNSLIMAQTKLFLAAQSGRETAGSCSESEEPLQPQDAGNARSPEAPEEQSQG